MSLDAMSARIAEREATLTAAGQSWRWQLRDRNGQWIEMGAKVKWMANGLARMGLVVGSPREGQAEVEESQTRRRLRLAANRLTVVANKIETMPRNDRGSIDVKALVPRKRSSQPEPDTVPEPRALGEPKRLPPARPGETTDEPRTGARARMWRFLGLSRNPDGSRREGRPDGKGTVDDPIYVGDDVEKAVDLIVKGKHVRMNESKSVSTVVEQLGPALRQAELDIRTRYNIPEGKVAEDFPEGSPERVALESLGLNMCAIQVPGTNVFCVKNKGIPRILMPQLGGEDVETGRKKNVQLWAEEMLESKNLIDPETSIPASEVTASQSELGAVQISDMLKNNRAWRVHRDRIDAMPPGPERDAEEARLAAKVKAREYMPDSVLTAPILITRDGYIIDGHHRWATLIAKDLEDGGLGDVQMSVREVDMDVGEALATMNEFAKAAGIKQVAPKGTSSKKKVARPKILDTPVRQDIKDYIAENMERIKAREASGVKKGILVASAVEVGDVLLVFPESGEVLAHQVLGVVAETTDSRTFLRQDIDTGDLSLAVLASGAPVVRL